MLKWEGVFEWGRRASDRQGPAPARPPRDRALEAAISGDRIDVQYQPIIEPATGRVAAAEALARSALVDSADELFARAGSARLEERLSRTIQRKALRRAAAWEGALKDLPISINLVAGDIGHDDYADWLLGEIDAAGIAATRITLEITESALVDRQAAGPRLQRLREAGLRVAVDDFGTGYASLAYLTELPLDLLKIDRGLITDVGSNIRSRTVVRTVIELAHDLDLQVLVEGVECTDQLRLLCDWGCDYYQGFLGAGALSEDELSRFVAASRIDEAAA